MAQRSRSTMSDVALVAVFAGVIAAFSLIGALPIGLFGVPITLQTMAVALAGLLLGPWRGLLATGLYLVLGFAGLPVFAGGGAGLGVLVGPSAGYLLAFPLAAFVTGWLAQESVTRLSSPGGRLAALIGAAAAGSLLVVHPLGIVGMHINLGLSWGQAFAADLIYIPGDLVKAVLAAVVAVAVHRALPTLLARPRVSTTPASAQS